MGYNGEVNCYIFEIPLLWPKIWIPPLLLQTVQLLRNARENCQNLKCPRFKIWVPPLLQTIQLLRNAREQCSYEQSLHTLNQLKIFIVDSFSLWGPIFSDTMWVIFLRNDISPKTPDSSPYYYSSHCSTCFCIDLNLKHQFQVGLKGTFKKEEGCVFPGNVIFGG